MFETPAGKYHNHRGNFTSSFTISNPLIKTCLADITQPNNSLFMALNYYRCWWTPLMINIWNWNVYNTCMSRINISWHSSSMKQSFVKRRGGSFANFSMRSASVASPNITTRDFRICTFDVSHVPTWCLFRYSKRGSLFKCLRTQLAECYTEESGRV